MTTCDGCWYASERARATGDQVECVCGATYPTFSVVDRVALVPDEPTAPTAYAPRQRPPVAPDARVSVAHDPAPSSAPPVARLTHVEDAETADVRRLLCELRPDKGGPLGWGPEAEAPAGVGSNWTPALRVQTSVEVPAILPGAFASTAPASRAPDLDHGFPGMPDDVRAVLRWCQRSGTLAQGLRALYQALALAATVSTAEQRDAWKAMPEGVRVGARVVYGRKRALAAMAVWWGPVATTPGNLPLTPADRLGFASRDTAAELERVAGRVRARVGMVVAAVVESEGVGG